MEKAESRSAWVRPSRLFPLGKTYLKLVVPLRLRLVVGPHRPRVEGLDGDSAAGHRLLGLPVVVELGPVIGEAGLHWERGLPGHAFATALIALRMAFLADSGLPLYMSSPTWKLDSGQAMARIAFASSALPMTESSWQTGAPGFEAT